MGKQKYNQHKEELNYSKPEFDLTAHKGQTSNPNKTIVTRTINFALILLLHLPSILWTVIRLLEVSLPTWTLLLMFKLF